MLDKMRVRFKSYTIYKRKYTNNYKIYNIDLGIKLFSQRTDGSHISTIYKIYHLLLGLIVYLKLGSPSVTICKCKMVQ